MYKGDYEAGIRELETAVALNPSSATSLALLGRPLPFVGRPVQALAAIQKAMRLNPFPPDWYLGSLGRAHLGLGQYEEAVAAYREYARWLPDLIFCRLGLRLRVDGAH